MIAKLSVYARYFEGFSRGRGANRGKMQSKSVQRHQKE